MLYNTYPVSVAQLVEVSERPGGVELVNTHRATKTATAYDLVELAAVVQRGDEGVHSNACNKLTVIADQIRYLQEQAKKVSLCYHVSIQPHFDSKFIHSTNVM